VVETAGTGVKRMWSADEAEHPPLNLREKQGLETSERKEKPNPVMGYIKYS